jgi:hypothetical protein
MTRIQLLALVKKHMDKYPMTGRPDKEAAYKNGWYDACYTIYHQLKEKKK